MTSRPSDDVVRDVLESPSVTAGFVSVVPAVRGFTAAIRDGIAVLTLASEGGPAQVACPTSILALRIAESCGLGPRRAVGGGSINVPWSTADVALRGSDGAPEEEPELARVSAALTRRWVVVARTRGRQARRLEVVDCEGEGLWLLQRADDRARLVEASATDVWRLLTAMLAEWFIPGEEG